jgi:ABC-type multidrug transport system ATPase subunit
VIIMHQGRIAAEDTMETLRGRRQATYICEVKAEPKQVRAAFDGIKGVGEVATEEAEGWTTATVSSLSNEIDLRQPLYAAIRSKGWDLRRFDVSAPTLEDIFVEITAR